MELEWDRTLFLEIVTMSQCIIRAATEYARRTGFRSVQSCHLLVKEMQKVSVAAGGILGVLEKSSLSNGPPLDGRLQDWLATDELPKCLETLKQIEEMFRPSNALMNTIYTFVMNRVFTPAPEDNVDTAVKLFDSQRKCFHFLLTTDIWNCEDAQRQRGVRSVQEEDGPAVEGVIEQDDNDATEADQDDAAHRMSSSTVIEENERKKIDDARKLDDILKWLNGLSCAAKQEETLSLRQPDTCTWLHSTPEYEAWKNSNDSSLWLQGKPGSGKTVLASFVIDSLENEQSNGEALAFFYCDFRNDRSTSASEVMRSLLSQLLRRIRNENIDPGDVVDDLVREKNGDRPVLENVKRLATFVSRTAKQFCHQPFVVVDALDECEDIKMLLDGLLILTEGYVRLFVTSRPIEIIRHGLRALPSLSMHNMTNAVSMDIALHVTRELDSSPRLRVLDIDFKMKIHSTLCDGADGMFRWAQCQIDTLNRCATRGDVEKALKSLPVGLDETYQRILVTIDPRSSDGKLALRALKWLVGALRPLRLAEIFEGLTIDLGKRTMDPEIGAMHKDILLYACGSLVSFNEKTDILTLSHFSVKEYLTGDLVLPRYHISPRHVHEHLARICTCYVALFLMHVHTSCEDASQSRIMQIISGRSQNTTREWFYFPKSSPAVFCTAQELLSYALADGFNHLAYLGPANRSVLKDMVALQLDIEQHPAAWERIREKTQRYKLPVPWPSSKHDFMLYVLTAFASDSLLYAFLGSARRKIQPRHQTNPLVYAAHFGKPKHAELLLSRGAKLNEEGLVVEAHCQALPLEVAVSRQQEAMVDLLLSTGAAVPQKLFTRITDYNFPIRIARRLLQTDEFIEWATASGIKLPSPLGLLQRRPPLLYEADIIMMIRRLVQVGLEPGARNSAQKTALHSAMEGKYLAVVKYLLFLGTPLPPDFVSALSRTASADGMSMLRFIVDAEADISVDKHTALHQAIKTFEEDECLEAVKILVEAGFDFLAYDERRKTPLHHALDQSYLSVADYLLGQQSPAAMGTLSAVMESRCPRTWRIDTMCTLIRDGADLNGISANGDGLLHRAVMLLDEDRGLGMTKFLVGAGCNPFNRDTQGKTPLDLALDRKSSFVADVMLSTVDPPADILFSIFRNALPMAWRAQTVRSLIERGADISVLSVDGNTLLHAAVLSFDDFHGLDVAKLLIGAGCDPCKYDECNRTPLHIALHRNMPRLTDYLISTSESPSPDALFAILCSARSMVWRAQTVCFFIDRGVDASVLSADGNALLHAAVLLLDESQAMEVAKCIFGAGLNPFERNTQGMTPLDLALDLKYSTFAEFLLSITNLPPADSLFSILRSTFPMAWRVQIVRSLIEKGVGTSAFSDDGSTLLHVAVLSLDDLRGLDMARLLVGTGCDPFTYDTHGRTPLHIALHRNFPNLSDYLSSTRCSLPSDVLFSIMRSTLPAVWRIRRLSSLLGKEADIHGQLSERHTLLHTIVLSVDDDQAVEVAKLLIDAGHNPFERNARGETLFGLSLGVQSLRLADSLLMTKRIAPPDALFAILCCSFPKLWKAQTVYSLVSKGADVRGLSTDGNTLLHATMLALDDHRGLNVAKLVIDAGCDPSVRNRQGKTVLHIAVEKRCIRFFSYILSLNRPLPDDILLSVMKVPGSDIMLDMLISKGVNLHVVAVDGNNLLHLAMQQPSSVHRQIILKALIHGGCDILARNSRDETPLHLAVAQGSAVLVYLLSITTLPYCPADILALVLSDCTIWNDTRAMLRFLIEKGADIHVRLADGSTLLHIAIKNHRVHTPSVTSPKFTFSREFHPVTILKIVKFLVDSGCDPSQCDISGYPPVYFARARGFSDVVDYLFPRTVPPPW